MNATSVPTSTSTRDDATVAVTPIAASPVAWPVASAAEPLHRNDTFDVCHGALVWRALLLVNAGLVLAAFASSASSFEALAVAGPAGLVGLVGTVLPVLRSTA